MLWANPLPVGCCPICQIICQFLEIHLKKSRLWKQSCSSEPKNSTDPCRASGHFYQNAVVFLFFFCGVMQFLWSTDTTTAWTSSAITTCWTPSLNSPWLKATRLASAWRTRPVTTDTTDDTPARHIPRYLWEIVMGVSILWYRYIGTRARIDWVSITLIKHPY